MKLQASIFLKKIHTFFPLNNIIPWLRYNIRYNIGKVQNIIINECVVLKFEC